VERFGSRAGGRQGLLLRVAGRGKLRAMSFLGMVFMLIGGLGLFWFGIPAVLALSEVIASRSTGVVVTEERMRSLKEHLYKVSGSIVFAAAGFSLLYFSSG
jgi:hypothetical protein